MIQRHYILKIIKKGTPEIFFIPFSEPIPSSKERETVSFPTMLIIVEFSSSFLASSSSMISLP